MKAGQQGQGGAGDGMKCVANELKHVTFLCFYSVPSSNMN